MSAGFGDLVAIMDRLRSPGGCPWDREQTYETLRGYLLEECYEAAEALDERDLDGLCEELGDVLLQIVFLSRLAQEEGRFTVDDVVRGIVEKMIRRHPHVFGDAEASDSDDVLRHWEAIKKTEKEQSGAARQRASLLDGVPRALPALLKAQRLGSKAARVGFDWERPEQVLDQVEQELVELREAMRDGHTEETADELGDLLFSLAMLARKTSIDPEAALERTNRKFYRRFHWMERELERAGEAIESTAVDRLEELWQEAKREES